MTAREQYEAAKAELRRATEARAAAFDAMRQRAMARIMARLARKYGTVLTAAERRLEAAARRVREEAGASPW